MSERESMEFDVVVVGAGPAGLATACRLAQLAREAGREPSVCVVEKGSEVGAHILSGALIETRALAELFPDWQAQGAPLTTPVSEEEMHLLRDGQRSWKVPHALLPPSMHNQGAYTASLGNLCRWLAGQAEALGVEIYPGFAAAEVLYGDQGEVRGIATGDMGVAADGSHKPEYTPGMDLLARYTVFAEGCRGHLGKRLSARFALDADSGTQHYGIGIKELWDVQPERHSPGRVVHGTGWPLPEGTGGGFFLYHQENHQVAVGLVVDLNYRNPWLSPFEEFQRLKQHPLIAGVLEGGRRVAYGARALVKGGFNALPRMHFPGGLIVGCNAGTLNPAKLKGVHTAIKTGMLAAAEIDAALVAGDPGGNDLKGFSERFRASWVYEELQASRSFGPALHRFGNLVGGGLFFLDETLFRGRLAGGLTDAGADYAALLPAARCEPIGYAKPDGVRTFDRLSSVYLSNTNHEEDQPCHLRLTDPAIPIARNLPEYAEPAQRYCPAGVYEVVGGDTPRFQINAANCVHCKTCDIKDPAQNITWVTPEGGGGPNYPNM